MFFHLIWDFTFVASWWQGDIRNRDDLEKLFSKKEYENFLVFKLSPAVIISFECISMVCCDIHCFVIYIEIGLLLWSILLGLRLLERVLFSPSFTLRTI